MSDEGKIVPNVSPERFHWLGEGLTPAEYTARKFGVPLVWWADSRTIALRESCFDDASRSAVGTIPAEECGDGRIWHLKLRRNGQPVAGSVYCEVIQRMSGEVRVMVSFDDEAVYRSVKEAGPHPGKLVPFFHEGALAGFDVRDDPTSAA